MQRVEIRELFASPAEFADREITVCGWVKTLRHSGAIAFVELSDGGCFKGLQVVAAQDELAGFDELVRQNVGAALIVK